MPHYSCLLFSSELAHIAGATGVNSNNHRVKLFPSPRSLMECENEDKDSQDNEQSKDDDKTVFYVALCCDDNLPTFVQGFLPSMLQTIVD